MEFEITGRVRERESGLGVRGIMVRAWDRDLLYDDLFGTAITDDEGRFALVSVARDSQELFRRKPEFYLSLYAPPGRLLMDTREPVRWEAGKRERFKLEIDRETLGSLSPTRPDDVVTAGLSFHGKSINVKARDGFSVPQLPGFGASAIPGAPTLPEQTRYVALPLGGDVLSLDVVPGEAVRLTGPFTPLPVQHPTPDVGTDPEQFGDGYSVDNVAVGFTPADPKFYKGKSPFPEKLVELESVEQIGALQMAAVRVRPVQYDPADRSFVFYPNLRFSLKFNLKQARRLARERDYGKQAVSVHYVETIDALLRQEPVVAARDLFFPGLTIAEHVSHLVITDNFTWPESSNREDGTTRAPALSERRTALSGDLVAEFERLAEWKTSRGVRSRVITVSDIVDGAFGDFTEGGFARDLPEVLRNFIRFAHKQWKVDYVLLGGDVNVVPMRSLVGSDTYETVGCARVAENPPPPTKCHVVAGKSVVKLRPGFTPGPGDPLSTLHGGTRVPFDREADSTRLGWYFTSSDDLIYKDEDFTRLAEGQVRRFVIVEGPASVIDDDYYWVRPVNSIPSDLYYASLVGPHYSQAGRHDFDGNDNGLYGQFHPDPGDGLEVSLDGVDFWSDVWVGRASAESGDQARAVVDKVITYERLETPDGTTPVDPAYLQKVLYASEYWEREAQERQADASIPPAESKFSHVTGSAVTKIRTKFDLTLSGGGTSHRLVARRATSDTVFPYDTSASAAAPGWHFATDDTYSTQSPTPTRFVRVLGPEPEVDPLLFFWDPVGLESAALEKETLRLQMNAWFPHLSSVERHYEDYFDLVNPPPFLPLAESTVRAALDNGVHLVSLSGHGSKTECCQISITSEPDFANVRRFFIAFADSCNTAAPDGADSLAEVCTNDADGGAVAYVGNTRYSWIGDGDNYERFFWHKLSVFGRLGPAAGLRLATGGVRRIWTVYAQTLFGDPEMPVWTDVPAEYDVAHPATATWGSVISVTVRYLGAPVRGHRVTLLGGWTSSAVSPSVWMTKTTNSLGNASFLLPATDAGVSELRVTVTHRNFIPYVGSVALVADS